MVWDQQQGPRGLPLPVILQVGGWFLARKKEENLFQVEWVHFKPGQFPRSGAPSPAASIVFVDSGSGFPAPWAMTVSGSRAVLGTPWGASQREGH